MPFALRLTHDEPRLISLALVYHLGRPGSELDPDTKLPGAHGLRDVAQQLRPHADDAEAVIELDEQQYRKLLSAVYGSVNELRVHHMRQGATSTVAGFTDEIRQLFPQITADPEAALEVAEAMMMLHRRLERAVGRAAADSAAADAAQKPQRRWFGRR
ncbi:MAG: hypothetical protein WEC75_12765 [Dehalococcoidia bacterium]